VLTGDLNAITIPSIDALTFITAGGPSVLNSGNVDRQNFLQPLVESIRAPFQPAV